MWKTVQYLPENLAETIELTKEYYGDSWISDLNFLRWQYESNPAGPAVMRLARDAETNQLAGQYVVIPMRFKANQATIHGTLSLNTLTRQTYTGQGIFTGLAKAVFQDCTNQKMDFCYGFPNPNSYPGFMRKLGFTDLGSVPLLLRPLNLCALVKEKFSPLLAPLALPFQPFYKVKNRTADKAYEVYPLTLSELPELDVFWTKIQTKYPIMGIRDAAYIRWRYFDIPLRDYQVYGIRARQAKHSELLGYIIGRCTEVAEINSGMVVDFLVDPKHPDAGGCLIRSLLRHFIQQGMNLAGSLMLPHTEESDLLKSEGFFTCPKALEPQPFPVVYRSFKPSDKFTQEASQKGEKDSDPLLQLNRWFLTMGDYDVI